MTLREPQELTASKPFVLVVDDNADDWFMINWTLRQHVQLLEAVWLSDADEVIPFLENRSRHQAELPKLIILDLYLHSSKVDIPSAQLGIRLVQALKSHHLYRQIPLVTLSWSAQADDISEALQYSVNAYLIKPVDQAGWLHILTELRQFLV